MNLKDLIEELNVDKIDRSSKFQKTTQEVTKYNFDVSGIKYVIDFTKRETENNESILDVTFKNLTAIEKLKNKKRDSIEQVYSDLDRAKYGLTNTGKSILVFNEIYNAVINYIEKFKPTFLTFEAVEDNRKKLYVTLLKRAEKQTSLKFEKINFDPETKDVISNTSQRFFYRIK